ncbi:aspartic peptidase domain-containing protein [Fomitopsis betulina]|nr:aspartic peptidase domain-containing protein [Fomitopsis betulina]
MLTRLSGCLTVLGALAVTANPIVRDTPVVALDVVRRLNLTSGATLLDVDRAHAQSFKTGRNSKRNKARAVFNTPVTNTAVSYVASVGVGSPATQYTLIVDTGSSNTWVGASTAYVATSSSTDTNQAVSVSYGSGSFSGTEYLDTVTLASGLSITQQSIGVASKSSGFTGVDGILGIGPEDLTEGTLTNEPDTLIATVVQNAYKQGLISTQEIGVAFAPTTSTSDANGVITFGGIDSDYYTGSITYVDVVSSSDSEAGDYVGITQSVSYGSTSLFSDATGIVDTGTTLLYFPSDAYNSYTSATGATADETTGLLRIDPSQYSSLEDLTFTIGSATYTFTPNAQIWPRSLNSAIGGSDDYVYLLVQDVGFLSELLGLDFINGQTWLERYYFVYNSDSNQVGFATTSHTYDTSN